LSLGGRSASQTEVLILDEPTSGVDPVARDGFWELLIRLSREQGVTIFLSTHFMNEAARCDRMSMMHQGKVLAQGPPAELVVPTRGKHLEEAFIGYLEEASGKAAPERTVSQPQPPRCRLRKANRRAAVQFRRVCGLSRAREAIELRHDSVRLAFAVLGPLLADDRVRLRHIARCGSSELFGARFRWNAGEPYLFGQLPRIDLLR
jgi:ribosome-dependent ATPase